MELEAMQKARLNPIARLSRQSPERRRLLTRAAVMLSIASGAVALLPFKRAIRLGCVSARGPKATISDCVWAIEAAARTLPWRTMCIEKGLALQRMLRRGGEEAVLHYGIRHHPDTSELEAHVWVSVDGETVLGGAEAPGFAEVARYP
jgi:hypothetical protein